VIIVKRILSIDGGGLRGVFSVSFLATVEDAIGDKISNYFDLIAGTSTGGIIALGLGMGYRAKEVLGFYEELGPYIFDCVPLWQNIRHLWFTKYSEVRLKNALLAVFGEKKLGDSVKRLLIPSMDLETGEVYIYRTSHHQRFHRDSRIKVVDVALSTASAPTYFPAHRTESGTPLIDGGMFANNPLSIAVAEAIGVLGWPRESIQALSIGCATEPYDAGLLEKWPLGIGYWAFKLIEVFMVGQSSSSTRIAETLIGHDRVIRVNPAIGKIPYSLDAVKEIPILKYLGYSEAGKILDKLKKNFFETRAEEFEPYHKL